MTTLSRSTIRRLQQLPQAPSVWEGDRRSLTLMDDGSVSLDAEERGDCILWVDGTDAAVRAMDMVMSDTGPEAMARTLLQAMEQPHGGGAATRPKKIVVGNREIQFFLRGVLQELDITVEYVASLPLIDEIFRGLQASLMSRMLRECQPYEGELQAIAQVLWADAPWDFLDEEKIISIELNYEEVEALYISTLGMLGVEYGILMYRSVDSLKQFRQRVLSADQSTDALEEAFLQQDCLFLTFEQGSEQAMVDAMSAETGVPAPQKLAPTFGNLHPLEGMRPFLHEEEAVVALVALEALHRFVKQHQKKLAAVTFPELKSRYRLDDPIDDAKKLSIQVKTLPDLAQELLEMTATVAPPGFPLEAEPSSEPLLRDDLIPPNSFFSLGAIPWDLLELMRPTVKFHQASSDDFPEKADGFPVILIQTSRPKAMAMIEDLKAAGGLKAICFNPGEDPLARANYDLGILQTCDGKFHLFGEFDEDDPTHIQAKRKWDQRCKKTKGHCGLVIAMGLTGASRGNPQLKDMMGLFEVRSLAPQDLGLGSLQLISGY
ncbi:MAG: hypothetical protein WBA57_08275 [Elainellaceae cyanobacterium]